jgi:hypothetical protein
MNEMIPTQIQQKPITRWRLLTERNADTLYFVPVEWEKWNKTDNGVFTYGRYLVFEYRGPNLPVANNKITLRGLLEVNMPSDIFNKINELESSKYSWAVPGRQGTRTDTLGYAVWRYNSHLAIESHHKALVYPDGGFGSDQDVFDWLDRWDEKIGRLGSVESRLWDFIKSVSP